MTLCSSSGRQSEPETPVSGGAGRSRYRRHQLPHRHSPGRPRIRGSRLQRRWRGHGLRALRQPKGGGILGLTRVAVARRDQGPDRRIDAGATSRHSLPAHGVPPRRSREGRCKEAWAAVVSPCRSAGLAFARAVHVNRRIEHSRHYQPILAAGRTTVSGHINEMATIQPDGLLTDGSES
jgi:hypothetical protein